MDRGCGEKIKIFLRVCNGPCQLYKGVLKKILEAQEKSLAGLGNWQGG
jgi:hypothetical protein